MRGQITFLQWGEGTEFEVKPVSLDDNLFSKLAGETGNACMSVFCVMCSFMLVVQGLDGRKMITLRRPADSRSDNVSSAFFLSIS